MATLPQGETSYSPEQLNQMRQIVDQADQGKVQSEQPSGISVLLYNIFNKPFGYIDALASDLGRLPQGISERVSEPFKAVYQKIQDFYQSTKQTPATQQTR